MISGGCLTLFAAWRNLFLENVLPTTIHTSLVAVGSRMIDRIFCHSSFAVPFPKRIRRSTTWGISFQCVRHLPPHSDRFGGSIIENGVRISRFLTAYATRDSSYSSDLAVAIRRRYQGRARDSWPFFNHNDGALHSRIKGAPSVDAERSSPELSSRHPNWLQLARARRNARKLNSVALTVYKIDYSDLDEKPEVLFMCLKRLVGPSRRFSN
jgi:hypothetical protein